MSNAVFSWTVKPVYASVIARWRRLPAFQESGMGLINLDAQRMADVAGILGVFPSELYRQVTPGTGGNGAEQVYLREELEVVSLSGGRGLHEVAVVGGESGHLEHVENIVNVALIEMVRSNCPHQVRVTAVVEVFTIQHLVNVWSQRVPSRS